MRKTAILALLILFDNSLLFGQPGPQTPAQDEFRRFLMVVGANYGGSSRTKLKYAVSDAGAILDVFQKIGGVLPQDSLFLVEPDRKAFLAGLDSLQNRIALSQFASRKTELVFYYSGHSDETGILIGNEKVTYQELNDILRKSPAGVRIAILDSCSSGSFTRLKGGQKKLPFLIDTANDMKGYAFMTSSSSDELSQESDKIKGAFFTHYLISGMRGAADVTQDGRVTLSEIYNYAYNETLSKTSKTIGGPQHPNYLIQMSGTGDVIMTDIRKSNSILDLDGDLGGEIFVRDGRNNLIVELQKLPGQNMQLGLEEGLYTVYNNRDNKLFASNIQLAKGENLPLNSGSFSRLNGEEATARGVQDEVHKEVEGYTVVPWSFTFTSFDQPGGKLIRYYSFNLVGNRSAKLDGFCIGGGPSIVDENARGLQISFLGNYAGASFEGLQYSALFNYVADDARGSQMGFVNVAKVSKSVQVGIINIAEEQKGLPVGLVNLSKNGSINIISFSDNLDGFNLGVKFISSFIYTVLAFSTKEVSDVDETGFGMHYGVHIPFKAFYFETDIGGKYVSIKNRFFSTAKDRASFQVRQSAGLNLSKKVSLFAGLGIDARPDDEKNSVNKDHKTYFEYRLQYFSGLTYSFK